MASLREQAEAATYRKPTTEEFFKNLPSPAATLKQYKIEKYGTAAGQSFETYKSSERGQAAIARARQNLGENKVQGIGRSAAETRLRKQAEELVRNEYVTSYVNTRFDKDAKTTGSSKNKGNTGSKTGSGKSSTKEESSDLKNPNFRKATDFDKNNPFDKNNTENKSFELNRLTGESFNINRFRGEVSSEDDILTTHSYLVVFSPMDWVTSRALRDGINSRLTLRCDNAILPTINLLQEQNIRRYGFGPVENVPYGINVGDFTLQFIVDKQAAIIDFFEAWMNTIVNRDSFGGANMNNVVGDDKRPYEVAYKDSYACPSVNVFVYDRAQNTVVEYNIYDVFPTGIQSMNLSWGEENTLMKLNVTFSFTDLRIRPKASNFDLQQIVPVSQTLRDAPITVATMDVNELVDVSSIISSIPADLASLPLIVGEGNNGVPRNTGVPTDTAAASSTQAPEVPAPTIRNTYGVDIGPPN